MIKGVHMRVLVIIPAYNEELNIKRVVSNLRDKYPQYDYVVVNDGSADSTSKICHEENFNIYESLSSAIGKLDATVTDFEIEEPEENEEIIEANPDVRNFTYTFLDGKLYFRQNSQMYLKEYSRTTEERIKVLDEIRKLTRNLIEIQT